MTRVPFIILIDKRIVGGISVNLSIRDMILVSFFAGLMTLGAFVSKIWPPEIIPFSLLPLLSLLAGAIIGPRLGALSILVYILLGLIGVPIFAAPPYGGLVYALQPSFGFLISFIFAAYVAGYIIHKKENPGLKTFLLASLLAMVVIYLIGLPWMYLIYNYITGKVITLKAIFIMMSLFMGLDFLKAILAAIIGKTIYERTRLNVSKRADL